MNNDASTNSIDALIRANSENAMSRDQVQQVLNDVAVALDCGELQFSDDGVVELIDEDETALSLHYAPGFAGVMVAAPVATSEQARGSLLRKLLAANLSWSLTQGATFAMANPDRQVVLCRRLACGDGDARRIARELGSFIERVRQWRVEIELNADLEAPSDEMASSVTENTSALA